MSIAVRTPPPSQLLSDVAILCSSCQGAVPLRLFVDRHGALRQVHCPHCMDIVVLHDAW